MASHASADAVSSATRDGGRALYPDRNDLFRNYPELEPDDVQQALAFAAANLEGTARETAAA